jgi:hypothetical protein
MFGNKKRLEDELANKGGIVAPATIVSAEIDWTSSDHTNSADINAPGQTKHMTVTVQVAPEGEPPFEATLHQAFSNHIAHPGWRAKVIYDPSDRSRIAILEDQIAPPEGRLGIAVTVNGVSQAGGANALAQLFAGGAPAKPDLADELTKLADLRDRGVLTDAEFEAQKAQLLQGAPDGR